jgi:hypothetical protein
MGEGDRVEILECRASGVGGVMADRPARVLRAYFDARRARASRRFLSCAAPATTLMLIVVQAGAGLLARGALEAQAALTIAVPAAAAVAEWRAIRRLHALVRVGPDPAI